MIVRAPVDALIDTAPDMADGTNCGAEAEVVDLGQRERDEDECAPRRWLRRSNRRSGPGCGRSCERGKREQQGMKLHSVRPFSIGPNYERKHCYPFKHGWLTRIFAFPSTGFGGRSGPLPIELPATSRRAWDSRLKAPHPLMIFVLSSLLTRMSIWSPAFNL